MTKAKEVHSDIPKIPNFEFCGDKFFAFQLANWQEETVEALEKRMIELTIFCQNPEPSPSDFVACLAIQRNLLLKQVLEALKGAGEQPK